MTLAKHCLDCNVITRDGSRCRACATKRHQARWGGDWRQVRKQVLARDGYRCQLRLEGCTEVATHCDHIVPFSEGGSNRPENLRAACESCNKRRGNRS